MMQVEFVNNMKKLLLALIFIIIPIPSFASFLVEHTTDFTTLSRTNAANATPQTQLSTSGLYDWLGGVWSTQAAGVLSVGVTTPGSYSVAPTVTFSATGKGTGKFGTTPTGTAVLGGGGIASVTQLTTGGDYILNPPAPSLSGGTGSGGVLAVPAITKTVGAGTVSATNGSAAVVGTSTAFLTDLVVGEDILITNSIYNISAIADNTHLTLTGNFAQSTASGLTYAYGGNATVSAENLNSIPGFSGANLGPLLRPSGLATTDQQVDAYYYWGATTNLPAVILRYNSATGTYGSYITVNSNNSHGVQITHFDGTSTAVIVKNGGVPSTLYIIGHLYRMRVSAVNAGTTTCTVIATITDMTAGGDIDTQTGTLNTATTYADVASAGQLGLAKGNTQNIFTKVITYNVAGLVTSPDNVDLNQTGVVINVSDGAADWVTNPPNFVASGTDASVTSWNVLTLNTATVTLSTGTIAGTIILTNTVDSDFGQITANAQVSPDATIDISTLTSSGATIAASGPPTNGNANYQCQIYRSPNSAFVYNDGSATLIHTQTGIGASTTPTSFVDTTAPTGVSFYRWVTTDSTGQITSGGQAGIYVPVAYSINIGFIGDSITNGHAATTYIQWLNTVGILTKGSGQTDGTYDLTFTGGGGTSGAGKLIISGGLAKYAYITNPGYGYTSETVVPTVSFTGGGGTPATLSMLNSASFIYGPAGNIGGGYPLVVQNVLRMDYGYKNLRSIDCGENGTATSSWLPHGAVRITNATNASPIVITTANAHGMTSGQQYEINTVGGNTAANGTWYVNVVNSATFSLYQNAGLSVPVSGNGAYTSSTGIAIGPGATTGALGYNLEAAISTFGSSVNTPYISIMLGANDANGLVTQAVYQQQLTGIVYKLSQSGYKSVLNYPLYWETASSEDKNLLLQQYATAVNNIIAAYPSSAFLGLTIGYGEFLNYPQFFADGLHPNDAGYGVLGGALASILASYIGLNSSVGGVTISDVKIGN